MAQMARTASKLSEVARNELSVSATQIQQDTDRIEASRSQYADQLNDIVTEARQAANLISKVCTSNLEPSLVKVCVDGKAAIAEFKNAVLDVEGVLSPYKKRIEVEIQKQESLLRKIEG
jgi:hypothetical protein